MDQRPYQQRAFADLRSAFAAGHRRVMLGMPTGSGKTHVAASLCMGARKKGKRVLVLCHLQTLVHQTATRFRAAGLKVGIMQGENTAFSEDDDVIVASIQTVRSRRAPDWIGLILIDEAHILHQEHIALITRWDAIPVIGLSATPLREDLGKYFTELVRGPSHRTLIDDGYLVPCRAYQPDEDFRRIIMQGVRVTMTQYGKDYSMTDVGKNLRERPMIGDALETWMRLGQDRQTLCFASSCAHSRELVDGFLAAGIPSAHVEAGTPQDVRRQILEDFRCGKLRIISSVGVFSVGFDAPWASCAIIARPIMSLALHLQVLGRLTRSWEDKENAIILDHFGNSIRLGLPEDFEMPKMTRRPRTKSSGPVKIRCKGCSIILSKRVRECPECGYDLRIRCKECDTPLATGSLKCSECGTERALRRKDVAVLEGDLVDSAGHGRSQKTQARLKEEFSGLLWYAQQKGYKRGWAYHRFLKRHPTISPERSWWSLEPKPHPSLWSIIKRGKNEIKLEGK